MAVNTVRLFIAIVIIILVGTMYYIVQEVGPGTRHTNDDVVSMCPPYPNLSVLHGQYHWQKHDIK